LKEIKARSTSFQEVVFKHEGKNDIVRPMLFLKVFVNWHQGDMYGSLDI
jgi:hypothetical protein